MTETEKKQTEEYPYITFKYKEPVPPRHASKVEFIQWRFKELNISIDALTKLAYEDQVPYEPQITLAEAKEAILKVLSKREIQHSLVTGINLDVLCENKLLLGPLQSIVQEDRGTYGIDEVLMENANLYGTIGITNAMGLDTHKRGIIKEIDQLGKHSKYTTTFLDDQLSVIVGSAEGYLAHKYDKTHDNQTEYEESWK